MLYFRIYLRLAYEYELHCFRSIKVSAAKHRSKNYMKVRLPLSAILCVVVYENRIEDFVDNAIPDSLVLASSEMILFSILAKPKVT